MKLALALFVATAALAGGVQALGPTPAEAAIDQEMTEERCNFFFGVWDWFNETCDVNFGGGPSYGGVGGGGGGSGGTDAGTGASGGGGRAGNSSADDAWKALDELAKAEAKAANDRLVKMMERLAKRLQRILDANGQTCEEIAAARAKIRRYWDGPIHRLASGHTKAEMLEENRQEWQQMGCERHPFR